VLELGCHKAKRTRPAAVRHPPVASDQVEPIRKRVVLAVGRIFHVVNQSRDRQLKFERADRRDFASRLEGLWLFEQNPFTFIGFNLPFVNRVRFSDVDDEELDSISEASMELFQVPSLGTERGSGVAVEDECNWLLPAK
jgi:hypothetical protein